MFKLNFLTVFYAYIAVWVLVLAACIGLVKELLAALLLKPDAFPL